MFSRKTLHVLKIVVATSLVWCLLDVFILNYFSGCETSSRSARSSHSDKHQESDSGEQDDNDDSISVTEAKGFMGKLMDKVPDGLCQN